MKKTLYGIVLIGLALAPNAWGQSSGHGAPSFTCAVNDTYTDVDSGLVWLCGPTANTWKPNPQSLPWVTPTNGNCPVGNGVTFVSGPCGGGSGSPVKTAQSPVAQPFPTSTTFLQAANNGTNRVIRVGVKGDSFTVNSQPGGGPGDGPLVSTNRWAEQLRIKGQANWGSHGTGVFPLIADNAGDLNALSWTCNGTTDHTNLSLGPFAGSNGSLIHMITGATCTFSDSRSLVYTNLSVYYATPSTTSSLAVVADGSTSMGTITAANSTQAGVVSGGLTARRYDSATVLPATTHTIVYTCTGDCYLYANDGVNGTTGFSVDLEGISGALSATYGTTTTTQLAFDALIPGGEQAFIYMDQTNDASNSVSTSTFSTNITNIVNYERALASAPTVMLAIPPVDIVNNTHAMAPYTAIQTGLCVTLNLTCVNIQSRGTTVGATSVGWGTTYNSASGLWDLTGATSGVHPNDAGNLDEFQMIYAQLFNPTSLGNSSVTLENVFAAAGSFTFTHNLNTFFYQLHCIARSGGNYVAASWTDFPVDANSASVTVTGAVDLVCSFTAASSAVVSTAPITQGLVECWFMNDGAGTTFADSCGTANTETLAAGTLTWQTNYTIPSTALFSATAYTTGANHTATNFSNTQPMSISAWVDIDGTVNVSRTIISTLNTAAGFQGWELTTNTSDSGATNHLHAFLVNTYSTNAIEVNGTTNLTKSALHYVVMTYDGSNTAAGVKFYIDGTPDTTTTVFNSLSATMAGGINPSIGGRINGTDPLSGGVIAFLRVYNRTLSAGDVSAYFAGGPK